MSTEVDAALTLGGVFLDLVPVLVGGALAAGGGIAGAMLNHKFTKEAESKKLRREKLEQMASAANSAVHWLDLHRDNMLFNADNKISLSPISEVEYLSRLYFKELSKETSALSLAVADTNVFFAKNSAYKVEHGALPKDFLETYRPLHMETLKCVKELIYKMSEIASDT